MLALQTNEWAAFRKTGVASEARETLRGSAETLSWESGKGESLGSRLAVGK